MYRWDRDDRMGRGLEQADYLGLTNPEFTRLLEELGGAFFLTPDGTFGSFPFETTADCGMQGWERCAVVPLGKVRAIDFGCELDEEELLMIWPWVARFARSYADLIKNFDRGPDLSPSEIDEELDKIQSSALRLKTSLERISAAGRMERPWALEEVRKSVAVGQILHRLEAAVADQSLQAKGFKRNLEDLRAAAQEARAAVAEASLNVGKVGNAGVQPLTTGCAYIWSDFSQRKPSAARRSSLNRGEESDFVLFVQSVAGLTSDVIPTIAQVRDALTATHWNTDPKKYFALRWNSTDRGGKTLPSVSGK